ncbi:MAG: hypothetical protein K0R14_126 [Burkholderiales bacterium]|jgi:hypothetical protein|nr:hypothetical protein [Burkholderiales bacterium]
MNYIFNRYQKTKLVILVSFLIFPLWSWGAGALDSNTNDIVLCSDIDAPREDGFAAADFNLLMQSIGDGLWSDPYTVTWSLSESSRQNPFPRGEFYLPNAGTCKVIKLALDTDETIKALANGGVTIHVVGNIGSSSSWNSPDFASIDEKILLPYRNASDFNTCRIYINYHFGTYGKTDDGQYIVKFTLPQPTNNTIVQQCCPNLNTSVSEWGGGNFSKGAGCPMDKQQEISPSTNTSKKNSIPSHLNLKWHF